MAQSAELGDFYTLSPQPTETVVRAGLVAIGGARYQGSNEQRVLVVPGVTVQTANGFFADPINGLGFALNAMDSLQYGLRATLETGRSTEDALPGFDKIKMRLNPGGFVNYKLGDRLTLKSALRLGVGDGGKGSVINLGASYRAYRAGPLVVDVNASVKYANSSYQQSYFGVTAAQSTASGLKAFQPAAGFNTAQLGVTAGFPVADRVYAFSGVSLQRLLGDASKSPIVQKQHQLTGFVGAVYTF
jgi:outer membrane scaffolding protein for murein synthesis (MipA/OmpV family)